MNRIVITGMGICCSIGKNLDEYHRGLLVGRNGIAPIPNERFNTSSPTLRTHCGAILPWEDLEALPKTDETILSDLAINVTREAIADSNLDLEALRSTDIGICLGTTVGGSYPFMKFLKAKLGLPGGNLNAILRPSISGTITGSVAKCFGFQGPISTISTACAAGTNSIGRAFDLIRKNRAQVVVAGGVDVFSELTFTGFNALQALSTTMCRPFDSERDGLVLGDGCAMLVLETLDHAVTRDAKIYAEVAGYSIANEAYHATGPDPEGSGALMVMQGALAQGHLSPLQLDYINAHGTATKANDEMELKAIQKLLGPQPIKEVYISSTKSMTGHTLGASGSIEVVSTALGIYYHFVPPTINLRFTNDDYKGLNFVRDQAIKTNIRVALSNSFGFGGNVASIALSSV